MAATNSQSQPKGRLLAFQGLEERQIKALYDVAVIKRLERDEHLIQEGDTDQTAYLILDGEIGVYKEIGGRRIEIADLSQGDWVGEIAFSRKIRRTASALAKEPSRVMIIDKTTINALDFQTQAYFYQLLNDLAAVRVMDLSRRETELTDKNLQLVNYIRQSKSRNKADYGRSDMIRGIISKVPRLPVFASSLVVKLLDENVSPGEVSEMVKEDPALVALVLKTVNSPFYGFKKNISDIHHAIVLLGFNEVYQLVVAEGVSRTMPDAPIYRQLQMHSLAVSHLAFAVSQETGLTRPAQAATVGLLHEIGRSIIRLLKDKNPNLAMLLDGLDPAQIGALLLREWNLPEAVWRCIEYQFHPEFSPPTLIPPDIRDSMAIMYVSHLCHDRLRERPYTSLPTVFLDDYKKILGWEGLSLDEVIQKRLLPNLTKKLNTFPASFRSLIKKGVTTAKPAAADEAVI